MIQIIEGPPRCGKSYYAVNYLMKFVDYDPLYTDYALKPGVLIISNIEGLKVRHRSLDEILQKRTIEEFFTVANFEQLMVHYQVTKVILLIDEFQKLFPDGYKNTDVSFFFQYHGHIGLDIFLMTQGVSTVARWFIPLVEYFVRVTPRSKSVLNNFSYRFVDTKGRYLYSKTVGKKEVVFNAYNSFRVDEHNKPKNAIWHWFVIITVFAIAAIVLFKTGIAMVKNKSKHDQAVATPISAVYANHSTVKAPKFPEKKTVVKPRVSSAPFLAKVVNAAVVVSDWSTYPVESFASINGSVRVMINGKWFDSSSCRTLGEEEASCLTELVGRVPVPRAGPPAQAKS